MVYLFLTKTLLTLNITCNLYNTYLLHLILISKNKLHFLAFSGRFHAFMLHSISSDRQAIKILVRINRFSYYRFKLLLKYEKNNNIKLNNKLLFKLYNIKYILDCSHKNKQLFCFFQVLVYQLALVQN